MTTIWVRLRPPYPIYVGAGLLRRIPSLIRRRLRPPGTRPLVAVVSTAAVAELAAKPLASALSAAGFKPAVCELPGGERAKSLREIERLYAFLLKSGAERWTPLVAVGGGTVGDSAGFAAATYRRGIPLIHVPTTLLAQVDSAIGGKTAANHPLAKNAVGAFHQPAFVACDADLLQDLPRREILSGLAEVVKYGLVFDPAFARWLLKSWGDLEARDPAALARAVRTSAAWKARVVAEDERDLSGRRELLNFGHTVGHALEAACGFKALRHGEAVAWGMSAAVELSKARGWLRRAEGGALAARLLAALAPPALPHGLRRKDVLAAMLRDKKTRGGKPVFVLLRALGRPVRAADVAPIEALECLERASGKRLPE